MTDHRPLVPILNHCSLDTMENPRLQCLKEILPYLFMAMWCTGKLLCILNTLSHVPVSCSTPEDEMLRTNAAAFHRTVVTMKAIKATEEDDNKTLEDLQSAARADPAYVCLLDCVTLGFPTNRC